MELGDERQLDYLQGLRGEESRYSIVGTGLLVWDTVAALVRAGFTAHTAIDKIYEVYGQDKTVTQIVNQMMRDRCSGASHPQLRI